MRPAQIISSTNGKNLSHRCAANKNLWRLFLVANTTTTQYNRMDYTYNTAYYSMEDASNSLIGHVLWDERGRVETYVIKTKRVTHIE